MTAVLPTRRGVVSTAEILADLAREARAAAAERHQRQPPKPPAEPPADWMRPAAIAAMAGVSQRAASDWLADGRIPCRRAPGDSHGTREARGSDVAAFLKDRAARLARPPIVIPADLPDLLAVEEVADIAQVSVSAVLRWAQRGLIRGWQVGPHRKWVFPAAEVRTVLPFYRDGGYELLAMRRGKGRSR